MQNSAASHSNASKGGLAAWGMICDFGHKMLCKLNVFAAREDIRYDICRAKCATHSKACEVEGCVLGVGERPNPTSTLLEGKLRPHS